MSKIYRCLLILPSYMQSQSDVTRMPCTSSQQDQHHQINLIQLHQHLDLGTKTTMSLAAANSTYVEIICSWHNGFRCSRTSRNLRPVSISLLCEELLRVTVAFVESVTMHAVIAGRGLTKHRVSSHRLAKVTKMVPQRLMQMMPCCNGQMHWILTFTPGRDDTAAASFLHMHIINSSADAVRPRKEQDAYAACLCHLRPCQICTTKHHWRLQVFFQSIA